MFQSFIAEKLLDADQHAEAFCGREWLFEGLRERMADEKTRALLIRGSAGVGKSSVVAKILQSLGEAQRVQLNLELKSIPTKTSAKNAGLNVLACHFCKHNDHSTLDAFLFIRSLGASLSKTLPGFQMAAPPSRAADATETFRVRLLAPLKEMKAPALPAGTIAHCILVDALDESLVVDASEVSCRLVCALHCIRSDADRCHTLVCHSQFGAASLVQDHRDEQA